MKKGRPDKIVLLTAEPEKDSCLMQCFKEWEKEGTRVGPFEAEKELEKEDLAAAVMLPQTGEDSWSCLSAAIRFLEQVSKCRPKKTLLITGSGVYGKKFGPVHALKEEEFGYLSHTSKEDARGECMRLAEHVGYRLAAEEKVNLTMVRLEESILERQSTETILSRLQSLLMTVFMQGKPGEAYNLSGKLLADEEWHNEKERKSVLEPVPVFLDSQKLQELAEKENPAETNETGKDGKTVCCKETD